MRTTNLSENDTMAYDWEKTLRETFGHGELRPGQQQVIEALLAGRSALAIFPTGGGKSLCYQLPALLLDGLTLVVSPLIALMKDQIDALAARGVRAARLDSSLTAPEVGAVFDAIRRNELKLLYVAPERFLNERFRATIRSIRVGLFAVDEAHCISEWGHNFRPDYLKLAAFAREFGAERVLALTATAPPEVADDIVREFEIEPDDAVRTGFYRSNLRIVTTPVNARERDSHLIAMLRERPAGSTIVYVTLQRTAETVAERLAGAGFPAESYHAGMDPESRALVQDRFMASDRGIVVATIAFGMGIDKANIRYVYHYNLPKSLESYSQEIGRAGRDGEPSICELIACADDLSTLENFAYGDTPEAGRVFDLVQSVLGDGEEIEVSNYELSSQNDIRILVVRTILVYLELEGLIEGGTPFYSGYKFEPKVPSAEILKRFDGDQKDFLLQVFRRTEAKKKWIHIDVERVAGELRCPREKVIQVLDALDAQALIDLRASGVRNRYRRLRVPSEDEVAALAETIGARLEDREAREIDRLHRVLALVEHDGCQVSWLGEHFGEPLEEPCGHCTWCESAKKCSVPGRSTQAIDDAVWEEAIALRDGAPESLGAERVFARFLVGVSSPQLTRAKWTKHDLFGAMSDVPYGTILERLRS